MTIKTGNKCFETAFVQLFEYFAIGHEFSFIFKKQQMFEIVCFFNFECFHIQNRALMMVLISLFVMTGIRLNDWRRMVRNKGIGGKPLALFVRHFGADSIDQFATQISLFQEMLMFWRFNKVVCLLLLIVHLDGESSQYRYQCFLCRNSTDYI